MILRRNLARSVFIAILLYGMAFIFEDQLILSITFAFAQIFIVLSSLLLIILRLVIIVNNSYAGIYIFFVTLQISLAVTNAALLLFNHQLIRSTLFGFLSLNLVFGFLLIMIIYKRSPSE